MSSRGVLLLLSVDSGAKVSLVPCSERWASVRVCNEWVTSVTLEAGVGLERNQIILRASESKEPVQGVTLAAAHESS